ncbi:MAG TPA: hypothetical protein VGS11_12825 [Candidatus Bathyarchaeia archaeon]|nr:hypothetical protein [Candidatus Bathyarchaeia archaeon]
MVDVSPGLFLLNMAPYIVSTTILAAAAVISFWLSRQRQSRGLFLIALGFLINLIIDGSWDLYYWLALGGPFQALVLYQRGLSVAQIGATIALTGLVGEAIGTVAYVSMLGLIIYGALQITQEHADNKVVSSVPV